MRQLLLTIIGIVVNKVEPHLTQTSISLTQDELSLTVQEMSKQQNSHLIQALENCDLHEALNLLSSQLSSLDSTSHERISRFNNLAVINLELGEFEKAKQLLDCALIEHNNRTIDLEDQTQFLKGILLNNLAYINFRFSQFECAETQLQTSINLKKESKSLLSEASIANSFHNQGVIFFQTACYQQCEEVEKTALLSAQKLYGQEEGTLFLLTELLICLNDKIFGRFQRASQNCLKVIEKLTKKYSNRLHPDLATARYVLGTIYFSLGEYSKALYEHEQSLQIREEVYGSNHFMTAFSLHSIGNIAYMMQNYPIAIEKYQACLQVRRKTYKQVTLDIAITLSDLGQVYSDLSKSKVAIQILSFAMSKYRIFLSDSHPDLGTCYNNLGLAYQKDRQEKKALEYFTKSFEIFETMKVCLPVMAISLMNLGAEFHLLGESEKGIKSLETCLALLQKVFPNGHPDIVLGYRNLGKIYEEIKEKTKSMICYMRSVQLSYNLGDTDDNNIPLILTKLNILENIIAERDMNGAISFLKSFHFSQPEKLTDESLYWYRMVQFLPKQLEMSKASFVEIEDF